MEMNTRLQVEHPVTEAITGIDLVEWQLRVARGRALHAAAVRYPRFTATRSRRGSAPRTRRRTSCRRPDASRCGARPRACASTTRCESGAEISPYYDSMIAKVIAHGATRDEARERLARALDETVALGVPTNKAFLAAVLRDDEFARGGATTRLSRPPLCQHRTGGAGCRDARDRGGAACRERAASANGIPGATIRRGRCG